MTSLVTWAAGLASGVSTAEIERVKKKAEKLMSRPGAKILMVGAVGTGKSTVINNCKKPHEPDAKTGRDPQGVTLFPDIYEGTINGQDVVLIDTPGIGDQRVREGHFAVLIDRILGMVPITGIVICNKALDTRVRTDLNIIRKLIEENVHGATKWENVILCVTFADKADQEEIDVFRRDFLDVFNAGGKDCNLSKIAVVASKPSEFCERYTQLEERISELRGTITYKSVTPDKLQDMVCDVMGLPKPSEITKEAVSVAVAATKEQVEKSKEVQKDVQEASKSCFAMDSTVNVRGAGRTPLRDLKPGDFVMDQGGYTEFVGFMHMSEEHGAEFVSISAGPSTVRATADHLLMTKKGRLVPTRAGSLRPGDQIVHSSGTLHEVSTVSRTAGCGYLAPLTASGTLYVDDILASCYVHFPGLSVEVMHAAMVPVRRGWLTMMPPDRKGSFHWYPSLLQALVQGSWLPLV